MKRCVFSLAALALALGLTLPAPPVAKAQEASRGRAVTPGVTAIPLDGSAIPGGLAVREGAEPMVWFAAAQRSAVGEVDPQSRTVSYIALGHGAKPRSLATCPNGLLYALDPALNVIHEITPGGDAVKRHTMPVGNVDLLGAVCTAANELFFTGYAGWLGKFDTGTGRITIVEAHGGRGPGAIALSGAGSVWFASYVSNQLVRVDPQSLRQDAFSMPRGVEGPKSVAVDGGGRIWISAFRSQRVARFDPRRRGWDAWHVGDGSRPHAIVVEAEGSVLVTDVGRDRLLRLEPATGAVASVVGLTERGQARWMARLGEQIWIAETAADRITSIDFRALSN